MRYLQGSFPGVPVPLFEIERKKILYIVKLTTKCSMYVLITVINPYRFAMAMKVHACHYVWLMPQKYRRIDRY